MKSFRKELWFELPLRRGFINITPQVGAALRGAMMIHHNFLSSFQ